MYRKACKTQEHTRMNNCKGSLPVCTVRTAGSVSAVAEEAGIEF